MLEHHNAIYILHREEDTCGVVVCLPDLSSSQTLFEFENTGTSAAAMTLSDEYVVAWNPIDKEQLIIYDFITKKQRIAQPAILSYPHFLSDGYLLTRGASELAKYKLESGELKTVWTCGELPNIRTISGDQDGLIYASTRNSQKSVYIISSEGRILV